MRNHHDQLFKQLMTERSFFEGFAKSYLPEELLGQIDWNAIELHKMSGSHIEDKTNRSFEADVVYLFKNQKINKEKNRVQKRAVFLWLHCEHQTTPDKNMILRVIHYQTAELLAYAKQNPHRKLPGIVTFIYYQGKNPWSHSLEVRDLFSEPLWAEKYFARPILIDLPALSDEILKKHSGIGVAELLLKHVRQKDFDKKIGELLPALKTVHDNQRSLLLKYVVQFTNLSKDSFIRLVQKALPQEEEQAMTLYENLIQEGKQEGKQENSLEIARRMLLVGKFSNQTIQELTEISRKTLNNLKKEIRH